MPRTFDYRCTRCGHTTEHTTAATVPPSELIIEHTVPETETICLNVTLKRVWGNIAIFNLVPDFSR